MKKLIIALIIVFSFVGICSAQTMHNQQYATVAWDAVPFPEGTTGAIFYQVYTKNDLVATTGTKVGGEIQATQLAIGPFSLNTNYYVGVETIFWKAGESVAQKSETMAWSYNAADCANGVTFGFLYRLPVNKPGKVRLISMLKEFIDGLPSQNS